MKRNLTNFDLTLNTDQLFEHTVYTDFTIYTPFMKEETFYWSKRVTFYKDTKQ